MCLYKFAHWHIHLLASILNSGIQKTLHARRTERSGGMV